MQIIKIEPQVGWKLAITTEDGRQGCPLVAKSGVEPVAFDKLCDSGLASVQIATPP